MNGFTLGSFSLAGVIAISGVAMFLVTGLPSIAFSACSTPSAPSSAGS